MDAELVSGPGAEQDRDRLSSMSMELAAAAAAGVSPSDSSRLGMEKEAESENSCWLSELPAVTTDELSSGSGSRSWSKPAGTHQRAVSYRASSQHPDQVQTLDLSPVSPSPFVL